MKRPAVLLLALHALAALSWILAPANALAQSGFEGFELRPPCEGTSAPAYGKPGGPPAIMVWPESSLNKSAWAAAPCLHWGGGKMRLAVALAATLNATSLDELLVRFGALSRYKSIRFWSVMYETWDDFVDSSGFVDGPEGQQVLPDYAPADYVTGRDFYYFEASRAGRTIHRMTVRKRSPDRIEIATENITPIRFAMATLFEPGALQSVTFFDRRSSSEWGYFQTIGVGLGSSFITVQSTSPYINRLTALYRYLAGIPTDRDPPAARH